MTSKEKTFFNNYLHINQESSKSISERANFKVVSSMLKKIY